MKTLKISVLRLIIPYEDFENKCFKTNNPPVSSSSNYFLSSDGKTFLKCDQKCIGCNYNKKGCIDCIANYYKVDNEGEYCYLPEEIAHLFENYWKIS